MSFGYSADIIIIDEIKYVVIDASKGVHPIFCSDFAFNQIPPYDKKYTPSTNNRRGYNLLYRIIDGKLFATKTCYFYAEPFSSDEQRLVLNGSFVIGKIEQDHVGWGHLFGGVEDYVDFDTAYEIFFENGILTDMRDISSAYQEYHKSDRPRKYRRKDIIEKEKIAVKYLRGCYYEAPYYVRESSYPEGDEIRIWNDPYDILTKENDAN